MFDDVLIEVESVSKKFCRSLKRSLWYGVRDIATEVVGLERNHEDLRKGEFWAVNDVSFQVRRGECLGIIGHNGAGKTTLLRLLNGLIKPDGGKVTMIGQVGALIALGAGFNPILTGRENIYVNAAILGLSKKEVDHNIDAIIDFAELDDFIDAPVQTYSSGMNVRLGFAIAAHVKPDVLILDEVLAVGDIAFVAKCFQHLSSIRDKTAIILISHDMRNISRICDRVLFIDKGEQKYLGHTDKAIDLFRKHLSANNAIADGYNSDQVEIKDIVFNKVLRQLEDAEVEVQLRVNNIRKFIVNIPIHRDDGIHCCAIMSKEFDLKKDLNSMVLVKVLLKKISLMPGSYNLSVNVLDECKIGKLAIINNAATFKVIGKEDTQGVYMPEYEWGDVEIK